jgi:D-amino-acid dehydrogenase
LYTADGGEIVDVDVVIIAAGAHSAELARQCGDPLPLNTERGYHVEFDIKRAGNVRSGVRHR